MKCIFAFLFALTLATSPAFARGHSGGRLSDLAPLIGVNAAGMEGGSVTPGTAGTDYFVPTAAELAYYHSKNLNVIRVPFKWERIQLSLGATLDPTYLGYLTTLASQAAVNGQSIILDVHNYGQYGGFFFGQAGGPTNAQFANLWTQIATAFVGSPGLKAYELMNEPHGISEATWQAAAQAAITAIRAVDTTTPIYVDGVGYSSAYQWIPNGNDALRSLVDPNSNLVFTAHAYGDSDNSGTYVNYPSAAGCTNGQTSYQCAQTLGDQLTSPATAINTNILVKRYQPFVQWCANYGLPCHVGESGVPNDDANWLTTLDNGIAYLQANKIPFAYFTAGPPYGSYALGVEPSNGIDTVQMAVLSKYANPYLPTAYQLSGPSRGTASTASTAFTASYRGLIKSNIIVTPSDGGSGGTFTPSSITLPPGFNASPTFTYTPAGTSVYAISTTNSVGMTDPSPVGFATIADQFSTAGLTPYNVYGFRKIYAPYIGPLVKVRRAADNATKDFFATSYALNAPVDVSAMTTWANGTNLYVVTWYDQGPNAQNMVAPFTGDAPVASPTNANQPQVILSCQNSLPCLNFNGTTSAMQATSPVNGNTAQTVMMVAAPALHLQTNPVVAWNYCCGQSSLEALSGDVYTNLGGPIRGYSQDAVFSAVASAFNSTNSWGATNGLVVGATATTNSAINYPYRSAVNIGFVPFIGFHTGKLSELVIAQSALSQASMLAFQSDQDSFWGIPSWPAYSWQSPTLNQSTSAANTPPWMGVNQGGIGFGTNFDALPVAEAQPYYASRGFNITRFPVKWEMLQQGLCTGVTTLDPTEIGKLDAAVSNITSSGMDILIDLHNYGGYSYTYNGRSCPSPPDDGNISSATTSGYFVNFWTQIAARYASNPKVKFDLMNEPHTLTPTQMATAAQNAITAIRGQGANQAILVEGGGSFAACSSFSTGAGAAFLTLTDPQNNLIAECHNYWDGGNSGSSDYAAQGNASADLTSATTYAAANGIKLFLGEFGLGFTPSMYSETKVALDIIAANPTVWVGWTAWGGGPNWSENYYFNFEPRATNYSPVVTPFVDRPVMRFLSTYATGGTWPCTTYASGSSGPCKTSLWPNAVQFP